MRWDATPDPLMRLWSADMSGWIEMGREGWVSWGGGVAVVSYYLT